MPSRSAVPTPDHWRNQLEPALVVRYVLDPSLLDGWTRTRVSVACRCVLAVCDENREHNMAAVLADLPSTVSIYGPMWALQRGRGEPWPEVVDAAIALAERASAMTLADIGLFGPASTLLPMVGARLEGVTDIRPRRLAKWQRDLARARGKVPA